MTVESVFGHYPELYKRHPMPQYEFFQYDIHEGILYTNHAADSLIYVYEYPDKLLYTIGYSCNGMNMDYTATTSLERDEDAFAKAFNKIGLNTGLLYVTDNNTLCRIYVKSLDSGESGMQIYKDDDLIADCPMPDSFQLLGYHGGSYYGACYTPLEEGDDTSLLL